MLESAEELYELSMDEYLYGDGVAVVEWPEKAEGRLQAADLALTFDYAGPDARKLVVTAHSPAGQAVLSRL